MYWIRKRLWSQNFFTNRELISKLIRGSSISHTDTVLDIGSGHGLITQELLKITPHVISIEKDPNLIRNPVDFLEYTLPTGPYKVFANIPFSITSDIIHKLLQAQSPPSDCYIIIQSEAADKFTIHMTNTMTALIYYPWWDIQIVYRFNRSDFQPRPRVDSVLLHIKPRTQPLVPITQKTAFLDFIAYNFIHRPQTKYITTSQWLFKFKHHRQKVSGAYSKLLLEQSNLKKIHRTRLDKNWRKFRPK